MAAKKRLRMTNLGDLAYTYRNKLFASEIMNYDTAKLRQFIQEYFSPDDLRTLLFDYFRPVHDDLSDGMTKSKQVGLLLEYCHNYGKMVGLLTALRRERPFFTPDDYLKGQKAPTIAQPLTQTAPIRNPRQIFISHAHQDAETAQKLAHDLEAHGYDIWIAPDSIRPGEKWVEAINRGLEESGLFVLLLSPAAVTSRWVNMETNVAITFTHEDEMQLYPMMLKACRLPALWRAFQHISLRGGYGAGLNALLAALEPAATPAAPPQTVTQPKPTAPPAKRPPPPNPDRWTHPKTGIEMVRVPAGDFLYGDEKQKMHLDQFWIAKTPVTSAEYARFVADTNRQPPKHWKGQTPPAALADHPVVYVSWHDAQAYAKWAGLALPTEQQWEKAARGTDGRKYPWGDEWRDNHCNTREAGIKTTSVGQFSPQGDSPYGCVDMSGNVREWTDSLYQWDKKWRVLRGGSWYSNENNIRAASRGSDDPDGRYYYGGFRVVVVRPPSQ
jgi:formylglycine-generating enzyme required for sulfatase activity